MHCAVEIWAIRNEYFSRRQKYVCANISRTGYCAECLGFKWQIQYSELMSWNKASTFHEFHSQSKEFIATFATCIYFLFREMPEVGGDLVSVRSVHVQRDAYYCHRSVFGQWTVRVYIDITIVFFVFSKRNKY